MRRKLKDARTPGDELLADELIGALLAEFGAPGQDDGAGVFFFLELLLHCCQEELFVGIAVERKIKQGGAGRSDLFCDVGGTRCGVLKLILEQKTLDLVVVDADGNDQDGQGVIARGEAAAHFLGGAVEAADGEKGIDAGADQES